MQEGKQDGKQDEQQDDTMRRGLELGRKANQVGSLRLQRVGVGAQHRDRPHALGEGHPRNDRRRRESSVSAATGP